MPAAAEDRALDPVATAVGEDQVTARGSEVGFQRVGIASPDHMDPHVHTVITHRIGQDEVEFLAPHQVQGLGALARSLRC